MNPAPIFVSYRQADARAWAVALRDELVRAFGEHAVFFDADSLQAGRWSEQIEAALQGCRALVVVMGRQWLDARDAEGRRRIDDPDDVHRREVEHGLRRPDVAVLPVLVDGGAMPLAAMLPAGLQELAARQALPWSARADHRALDRERLLAAVQEATGMVPRRPRAAPRMRAAVASLAGGLLGTVVLGAGFSMASMPLDARETAVVFVFCSAVAALVAAGLARWRTRTGP
jgi:hypothetical protein